MIRLGVADYLILSLALAIFSWFGMARLVRGQVLQVRENQYVEAARATGVPTPAILLRHVLPNVLGPIIVLVSAGLAGIEAEHPSQDADEQKKYREMAKCYNLVAMGGSDCHGSRPGPERLGQYSQPVRTFLELRRKASGAD